MFDIFDYLQNFAAAHTFRYTMYKGPTTLDVTPKGQIRDSIAHSSSQIKCLLTQHPETP
jgi:hypothetical protein